MSPKHLVLAAVSAIAVCAASVALAQDETPAPAEAPFTRMQEMSDAFHATTDPAERRALMQQHMALMMQQMHEGGGMMMGGASTTADGEDVELPRMQSHMDMMHQMMMQMMSQQDMIMRMQEQEEDDDE